MKKNNEKKQNDKARLSFWVDKELADWIISYKEKNKISKNIVGIWALENFRKQAKNGNVY